MPDEDPLAALSAAAKNRTTPSRLPNSRPTARPPQYAAGPSRPAPRRPKKSPLPFILGGIALLIIIVVVAVAITIKVTQQTSTPSISQPTIVKPIIHPPGELFKNVPSQDQPSPDPAPIPPSDAPQ